MSGIYSITNLINGKRYIGQSVNITKRWNEHRRKLNQRIHSNIHLQYAWDFYGEACFRFEILELCLEQELDEKECFYIEAYNSANREYGYNIENGGNSNKIVSDETRQKISQKNIQMWEKPEYRERMKEALKGRPGHPLTNQQLHILMNGFQRWWHNLSDEQRQEAITARKRKNPRAKPPHIKDKNNGMYGRHRTETEKEAWRNYNRIHQPQNKRVAQLNLDTGEIINIYISAREAERITGIDHSGISRTCNNKAAFAGGFGWKYIDKEADNDRKTA